MNAQLKKGVLELCVLSRLRAADRYGYELTSAIGEEMAIAAGTLYPILKRLKDEGRVETYLVESDAGPARKYYHLTEAGHAELERQYAEWLEFANAVDKLTGRNDNEQA